MNIKNLNIWKNNNISNEYKSSKIDKVRLDQFMDSGYSITQYEDDFFIVERIKSKRSVTCSTIDESELVANIAIILENNHELIMEPSPLKRILGKAETLIGRC